MGIIHLLEDHIANQIAAGEVVERPASVVKELVENAIDAEATRIDIHIEEGGLRSIRIKDNGRGMASEDCVLAFSRHATSKIRTGKDLFKIATLGFRGEALPSIAAVSKVLCRSNVDESGLGTIVEIHGGTMVRTDEDVAGKGTEMIVTDLFYNTPARLKYLKSVNTELSQIGDHINRLAMAHPHIAFHFYHEGRPLLQTSGNGQLLYVIQAIYGTDVARNMVKIEGESLDFNISGYMSKPELTRANRNYMTVIVNGRAIRNIPINQAILKGYHTLLPINRYPVVVLHIDMDPSLLDVNVHPAKLEVRFSKEQLLADEIAGLIESIWQGETLIPTASPKALLPKAPAPIQPSFFQEEAVTKERETVRENEATLPMKQPDQIKSRFSVAKEIAATYAQPEEKAKKSETTEAVTTEISETTETTVEPAPQQQEANHIRRMPFIEPVGQVHGTYIIGQNESGMFMIDQHAAHERIYYEQFMRKLEKSDLEQQQLLIPIMVDLVPGEIRLLEERSTLLNNLGIFYESFGTGSIIVRSHPLWFPTGTEEELVRDIIDFIIEMKRELAVSSLREKAAIMMSCKAAIKANQYLSKQEMIALFQLLNQTTNPYTCPHGRPIIISFSTYDLEKMFKRVM